MLLKQMIKWAAAASFRLQVFEVEAIYHECVLSLFLNNDWLHGPLYVWEYMMIQHREGEKDGEKEGERECWVPFQEQYV